MLISIHFLCLFQFPPTLSFLICSLLEAEKQYTGKVKHKIKYETLTTLKNTHFKNVLHEDEWFRIWQDLFLSLNNLFPWLKHVYFCLLLKYVILSDWLVKNTFLYQWSVKIMFVYVSPPAHGPLTSWHMVLKFPLPSYFCLPEQLGTYN